MSIAREVTIWCDAPECGEWGPQGEYATTAAEARIKCKALGWKHRDGLDFCPEHVGRRG